MRILTHCLFNQHLFLVSCKCLIFVSCNILYQDVHVYLVIFHCNIHNTTCRMCSLLNILVYEIHCLLVYVLQTNDGELSILVQIVFLITILFKGYYMLTKVLTLVTKEFLKLVCQPIHPPSRLFSITLQAFLVRFYIFIGLIP